MADREHGSGNNQQKPETKHKEYTANVTEEERRGVSVPLIIVIILVVIGGFYLMKNKEAKAPEETAEVVEPTPPPPASVENPVAAERTSRVLANGLGIDPELIAVVSIAEKEWSDGCLGLAKAGEMCIQSVTPGYEVVLEAQNVRYTYRTDKAVNQIRLDRSMMGK